MTTPKLTRWFKCSEKQPTIPGWYDARYVSNVHRKYWSGTKWLNDGTEFGNRPTVYPNDAWRGLASDPEAGK